MYLYTYIYISIIHIHICIYIFICQICKSDYRCNTCVSKEIAVHVDCWLKVLPLHSPALLCISDTAALQI